MDSTELWTSQHLERVVALGDAVKTVGGSGRVGGYLVRFGDAGRKDLMGEYFSAATDFGKDNGNGAYCLFHHSIPLRAELEHLADHFFQPIETRRDDLGIWAETVLNLADAYERMVYKLVREGKLSWSSGSIPHMVRKAPDGHILRWPIVEGSLTPTPAQPLLTLVQAIKVGPVRCRQRSGVQEQTKGVFVMGTARNERNRIEQTEGWPKEGRPEGTTGEWMVEWGNDRVTDIPSPGQAVVLGMQGGQLSPDDPDRMGSGRSNPSLLHRLAHLEQTVHAITRAPALHTGGFILPGDANTDTDRTTTSEEHYLKAYHHYVYTGDWSGLRAAKMQMGVPAEGGYLVPHRYAQEMVVALKEASIMRQAGARVIHVAGTDALKVPVMTHSTALAALTGEEDAFVEAEPTVGEITFSPYKYTKLSKVSDELLESSRVDVVQQILIPDAAYAFAAAENVAFVVGTGSNQPEGVVTGASLGVTRNSALEVDADAIIDLYYSLGAPYRQQAVWLMKDATAKTLRHLQDSSGQYLWQSGLQHAQPTTLLGRPVYTVETMPALAPGQRAIVFGDLSYFWIVDFSHLTMTRLSELYAATGQVGFRWFHRVDSRVVLSEAIKYLAIAQA